ncbi:MAG: hypothetical protein AAF228_12900 [Pseudomonadota bacterium]
MHENITLQGNLFTRDFLTEAIKLSEEWKDTQAAKITSFKQKLSEVIENFPHSQKPNEAQTEKDLIWPILELLGWSGFLTQQNLAVKGRENVPDGLLFISPEHKKKANTNSEEWKRYSFGSVIIEAKRWEHPLDRSSGKKGEEIAPSTQMLRYLRRVDDLTQGQLRWGFLTNGRVWRLYYQGAKPVAEDFFELDLLALLDIQKAEEDLFALNEEDKLYWLHVFFLIFRCEAFQKTTADQRTFHQKALEEGHFYEQRVTENLSKKVFVEIFPTLTCAIAQAAPDAPLQDVREATLILLYRLLFILYAEDRNLLPINDTRYDDYGLREKVREDIGRRIEQSDVFAKEASRYWSAIDDLTIMIDKGAQSIGLPPYNGGLFDTERTPLLKDIRLGDDVIAKVIDALSYESTTGQRKYINYRDLSVQQLGSIHERLLEYELKYDEQNNLEVRPNIFARKNTGSYYTPEDLVGLILEETLEPLIHERIEAFRSKADKLAKEKGSETNKLGSLWRLDPAEAFLNLKICDPAMGSGHFLVSLVDALTDHVINAVAEAENIVTWANYVSPLTARIEKIRQTILGNAEDNNWVVDENHLDDRNIIRRMVLKRCVYGVDKNPMAVELPKVALWLHTFTVGAPLSFLDHHLRCGDSLFGSWTRKAMDRVAERGGELFPNKNLKNAYGAAQSMHAIENLTDAEIAEAHRSAGMFEGVVNMTEPFDKFLSFIHALDWLNLKDKLDITAIQSWLDGQFNVPIQVLMNEVPVVEGRKEADRFYEIKNEAKQLITEERFLNWHTTFPGIWKNWESWHPEGGFDAVIGNPPWDRIKLQQVEWFAERKKEIASAPRASDRKKMIKDLQNNNAPFAREYEKAAKRAENTLRMARFNAKKMAIIPCYQAVMLIYTRFLLSGHKI